MAVAYGAEALFARLENPKPGDYAVQLVVGLACLYGAFASRGGGASKAKEQEEELSPLRALVLGADFLMPWLMLALGLWLMGDAVRYYFSI